VLSRAQRLATATNVVVTATRMRCKRPVSHGCRSLAWPATASAQTLATPLLLRQPASASTAPRSDAGRTTPGCAVKRSAPLPASHRPIDGGGNCRN